MSRLRKSSGITLLLLQVLFLGLFVVLAEPAFAVTCSESPGPGNWFISVRGSTSVTAARGVKGSNNVHTGHLEAYGGLHVESIYTILDRSNFVEFGWYWDRVSVFTSPKRTFDARSYSGVYSREDLQSGISEADHSFQMSRETTTNHYRFTFDSTTYSKYRAPGFNGGSPVGMGEIFNQCDDGNTHWWNLQRRNQSNSSVSWSDWTSTHWTCDLETGYGYTAVSNTEFKIDSRTDTFHQSSCNPVGS